MRQAELFLIIGPCGAGKTTYARKHYPTHLHPDRERLMQTLFVHAADFRYFPSIRSCGALLIEHAVKHLLAKQQPVCLTISGATRKERMHYSEIAFSSGCDTHVIRLLTDEATCITRAKSDQTRPVSSRQYWQEIVAHWFRDFEPVDLAQEWLSSYREVE